MDERAGLLSVVQYEAEPDDASAAADATQGATRGATNALLPELAGPLLRDLIVGVRYLGAASGSRHVGFADRVAKMKG